MRTGKGKKWQIRRINMNLAGGILIFTKKKKGLYVRSAATAMME